MTHAMETSTVRHIISRSKDNKLQISEEYELCRACKGWGFVFVVCDVEISYADLEKKDVVKKGEQIGVTKCSKCDGRKYLDWIEQIMGIKK